MFQLRLISLLMIAWALAPNLLMASEEGTCSSNVTGHLRLKLEAPQSAPLGVVKVIIENTGTEYVVISPWLFPQPIEESQPWGHLEFEIYQASQVVEYVGEWLGQKLREPSPEQFLVLPPQHFFGMEVDLTQGPFAYALTEGGTFRIRAQLSSTARQWLLQSTEEREALSFDIERVFDGCLRSGNIVVEYKSKSGVRMFP